MATKKTQQHSQVPSEKGRLARKMNPSSAASTSAKGIFYSSHGVKTTAAKKEGDKLYTRVDVLDMCKELSFPPLQVLTDELPPATALAILKKEKVMKEHKYDFLTPMEVEVVWTTTSAINNCELCLSLHSHVLNDCVSPKDLDTIKAGGVPAAEHLTCGSSGACMSRATTDEKTATPVFKFSKKDIRAGAADASISSASSSSSSAAAATTTAAATKPTCGRLRSLVIATKYALAHKGIILPREWEHLRYLGFERDQVNEILMVAAHMYANNLFFVSQIAQGCSVEHEMRIAGPFANTVYMHAHGEKSKQK